MLEPQAKRSTLRDVADLAGVSYQTVSRVINQHPNVAKRTRERVLSAIHQLDYHPNQAAKVLATGRSYILQLLMYDIRYSDPLPGMIYAARKAGYTLLISELSPFAPEEEIRTALDDLTARMIDGLIVYTPRPFFPYAEMVRLCRGVPFVLVGAALGMKSPSVMFDQRHGCELAIQHLLELGHRQIAEITGQLQHIDAQMRHEMMVAMLRERGLRPGPSVEGDFEVPSGYAATKELLDSGDPFTALFVANDRMALGALRALHERGVRVPEDVSVVGFDDMGEAAYFTPPLTTVRQDLRVLAHQSIEYLVSMLQNPALPVQQRVLYPELIVRGSTAPLK